MRPAAAAIWLALAGACARDDVERHELDGLVVLDDLDEPICAGTFAFLERRLGMLERVTGLPRDPRGLVFHWIYGRDEIGEYCVQPASGCTPGRDFYAPLLSYSHELVHAHLDRLGRPRAWLTEGMAVMLDDEFGGSPDPSITPSDLLRSEDAHYLNYSAAGSFTGYLRDRYGMARLLEFYEASAGADIDGSLATFGEVFGDDFSAVEQDYLATFPRLAVGAPDCDVPEVGWGGSTWSHDFDLVCYDAESIGPQEWIDDPQRALLWSGVTLHAPAGWYSFDLTSSGEAYFTIQACENPEAVFVWTDEPRANAQLAGGRYRVSGEAFIDTSPTATLTVRPLDGPPTGSNTDKPSPLTRMRRLAREVDIHAIHRSEQR